MEDSLDWLRLGNQIRCEYDSQGRLLKKWFSYTEDEGGLGYLEYEYDSLGNYSLFYKVRYYWPEDTGWFFTEKVNREFDQDKNLIKEEMYKYSTAIKSWLPDKKTEPDKRHLLLGCRRP